ncbi:dTMP kinase [Candidatus Dependentiae bacterium]
MSNNGLLIVLEGMDGSGKSLLANKLHQELVEQNNDVILTFEPGDTTLGKKLRKILHEEKDNVCDLSEYLLFAADRAQHFEKLIIPALKKNKIIISDRMNDSSVAYQGFGRNLDIEMIKKVNQWSMKNIQPDLIFYLEIDIDTAMKRIFKRNEKLTSFEKEKLEFWKKVITGYNTIYKDKKNVIKLDATLTPNQVFKNAMEVLSSKLQHLY